MYSWMDPEEMRKLRRLHLTPAADHRRKRRFIHRARISLAIVALALMAAAVLCSTWRVAAGRTVSPPGSAVAATEMAEKQNQ